MIQIQYFSDIFGDLTELAASDNFSWTLKIRVQRVGVAMQSIRRKLPFLRQYPT